MANEIRLKRGSGSDPSASDLVTGEIAVRTDNGKLFTKKDDGSVAEISGGGIDDGDKGDITVSNSGATFTIDNDVVSTAKMANMPTSRILGREQSGTGDPQYLTATEARSILNVEDGATADQTASEIVSLLSGQNITTGDLTISSTLPVINLTDTNNNSDYQIKNGNGDFNIKDTTNNVNRLTIQSDGQVNIGGMQFYTSNNVAIPVDGARFKLGANDDFGIRHDASGPTIFDDANNQGVKFQFKELNITEYTGTNTKIKLDTNGNVAIGTSTIADDADHCKLVISGQSGTAAGVLIFQDTSNNEDGMVFADNGNLYIVADRANATSNSSIRFRVDGSSEKMRLDSSGNLVVNDGSVTVDGGVLNLGEIDTASGHINSPEVLTFNIDTDNDDTNRYFAFYKNGASGSGTQLFKIDESGNVTVAGTVDGVDIATRDTLFGGLTSSSGVLSNGVTATTQSAGDDSTKIATTAYTDTAIANLIDSSPSTLNTLNELAAALGDDPNFATTVTTSIATKMPKSGGAFTGSISTTGDLDIAADIRHIGNTNTRISYGTDTISLKTSNLARLTVGSGGTVSTSANLDVGNTLYVAGVQNLGNGSGNSILSIKKADDNIADHIRFFNGTTRVGEIGASDDTWLRINNQTNKNIFTPRLIRADGGFFVDGTTKGINGSGNFTGGTIAGASDYSTLLRSDTADTASGDITFSGGGGAVTISGGSDIRLAEGNWTGNTSSPKIQAHSGYLYLAGGSNGIIFRENGTDRCRVDGDGHFRPQVDSTYDLGLTGTRWRNVYADNLHGDGSNIGSVNAATLDSLDSTSFLRSDANDNVGGTLTFVPGSGLNLCDNDIYLEARVIQNNKSGSDGMYIGYANANSGRTRILGGGATSGGLDVRGSGVNDVKIVGNTVWHSGNDGASSGLNADLLDGLHAANFLRGDTDDDFAGRLTFSDNDQYPINVHGNHDGKIVLQGSNNPYITFREGTSDKGYLQWHSSGYFDIQNAETSETLRVQSGSNGLKFGVNGTFYNVWHEGNDGAGSGLNADLLDGINSGEFLRSNAADTANSDITFNGGAGAATIAAHSDIRFNSGNWTGEATKIQKHGNYLYLQGGSSGFIFRHSDGTNRWVIDSNGTFRPNTDQAVDIGTTTHRVGEGHFIDLASRHLKADNGIVQTKQTIAFSYSLTANYNAMSVDPTVNNGVTVTVPSGAVWAIV